ncbi:choloylglycine hydrolase family protein [Sporolactobacillus shoreicorticis]|uniref:Choloylglycine hydrolase family protein n=1 Tax=Sporolactobacillus shoreicorticis TaxID=1923877 RepID=A0ABW5S2V5_9BACL|nr:choloylglycine hydrolase family protein [Sporolactobacillus shoreicorticis]MCO7125330.1 choloylglycine hydrolase family protein [Sporolactobacillus shoreicorticis]
MCTSLTLQTKDGHHLFGRTMDFAMDLNQRVIITPRRYKWDNITQETITAKLGVVGMGTDQQGKVTFADGLNESGLACATLYLPGFASYNKEAASDKTNLPPQDFVLWCLTQFNSVQAVKEAMTRVAFLDVPLPALGVTPPLHWILSDKSGACIVIEATGKGVQIYDNPVGVMTNSPEFDWHLQNLRQYIGLQSQQFAPTQWIDLKLSAFSQGSGSFGLPGDFTPPSRFVRAAFLKQNLTGIDNEANGITGLLHVLSNCSLPKGVVVTPDNAEDYTLYTSAMCLESGTYYYQSYDCQQISAVHLFNENLDSDEVKVYPYHRVPSIHDEN